MAEYDDLVRDLTALGRTVETPVPSAALTTMVMERLPAEAVRPGRSRRVALVAGAWWRSCSALLAAPPVRAAVADWFGFGGVRVEQGGSGAGTPGPPPEVPSSEQRPRGRGSGRLPGVRARRSWARPTASRCPRTGGWCR